MKLYLLAITTHLTIIASHLFQASSIGYLQFFYISCEKLPIIKLPIDDHYSDVQLYISCCDTFSVASLTVAIWAYGVNDCG